MRAALVLALAACTPAADDGPDDTDTGPEPYTWPEPDAWGPRAGPGVGAVSFAQDELFASCGALTGDLARSAQHHNLAVMYDGWLVMPWAPEDGVQRLPWDVEVDGPIPTPESDAGITTRPGVFGGGITLFELRDPCNPIKVGEGWSPWMRESHSLGFSRVGDRTYAVVDYLGYDGSGGIGFWDITDPTNPFWASQLALPGHTYPDSYTRLTLSVFWQGPYVFASTAFLGVFVIDASDPLAPTVVDLDPGTPDVVDTIPLPLAPVGSFHVWGNRGLASSAGVANTRLYDVSDPRAPQLAFEGEWLVESSDGDVAPYYFANVGSRYGLFARKESGGGPIAYDLSEPDVAPVWVGQAVQDDGDGGYVFQHEDFLFQGESNYGAVYDFSDPTTPTEIGRVDMRGDFDTLTPLGNLMLGAVDDDAEDGKATLVFPWTGEPDTRGPKAGMTSPVDGAAAQAPTSRIGVAFDEMIEPVSLFEGSFRVWDAATLQPVPGTFNVQENLVNFTPDAPLPAGATIEVHVPAGGVIDLSGNPIAEELRFAFTVRE